MKSPISVIILSYNRKAYLSTAIESVLAQTYPHFELLIWDDGSTDGSLQLAHRYAERDARVRVVSAPHSGAVKARQQAIAQTRYEYLSWVDSDDWLAPTALAETVAVLDAHPEVGLVYTDHMQIDPAGHILGRGRNSQIPYSKAGMLVDFLTFHFRLLRRSLYDQVGGLDLAAGNADDYDLCLKLSELTQVMHLRQSLYHYRVHPHSLSQQNIMAQVQCSKQAIERALERRGLSDRLRVKLTLKPIGNQQVVQFSLVRKRSPQSVTPIAPIAPVAPAAPAPVTPSSHRAVVPGPWLTPSFWRTGVLLAAALPITGLFSAAAIAQSVTSANDRAGTTVNRNGNEFNITGGQRNGGNLFHSFERFGLNRNEVANFLTDAQVQNVLGRVTGGDPSVIDGLLRVTGSNANLFLLNPAGILFGANARLDLPASFLATTASGIGFDNGWFSATGEVNYSSLTGNPTSYAFSLSQPGAIVNAGDLSVTDGANLTLLAGTVVNTGRLSASGGQVTVAAVPGENLVRLSQPGSLLSLDIAPLGNNGPNPLPFTAQALPELLTGGNLPDATGLTVNPDGTVSLASGTVIPTGAGTAIASGTIDVSSPNRGGTAAILGDRIALVEANINATGTSGGGTLLIGGDYHGGGSVFTASRTFVDANSRLSADALSAGNGGRVIVWADDDTQFWGTISARGGATSGNGGFVEVSGAQTLTFRGIVDTSAVNGDRGTLLLDPENIIITPTGDETAGLPNPLVINQNDFPGQTVTILESTLESLLANNDVRLEATNDIRIETLSDGILQRSGFGYNITSLAFIADSDSNGVGSFSMNTGDTIDTAGGNLTIQGTNITAGNLQTTDFGFQFGAEPAVIRLTATGDIQVGDIDVSDSQTPGSVFLTAGRNILANSIDASGRNEIFTPGGTVNISGDLVEISGITSNTSESPLAERLSIDARGSLGGVGNITIRHGGGPNNTPFVIGVNSANGTAGGIAASEDEAGNGPLRSGSFSVLPATGDAAIPASSPGITLTSVNEAPTLANPSVILSTRTNRAIRFIAGSVIGATSDVNNDNLLVRIVSIPAGGRLFRNGVALTPGTVVSASDELVYRPPTGARGLRTAFQLEAVDLDNGSPALTASAPVNVQINIRPAIRPGPTPTPTPTIVSPEVIDPRPDLPPTTTTLTVPTVPTLTIDPIFGTIESSFTDEFTNYLGMEEPPVKTLDDAEGIAQEIEDATGIKPAFVYINFVPAGVGIAESNPLPQDTDQLELVLVTSRGGLVRRRVPEATRARVLAIAQEFRGQITNPRLTNTTSYLPSAQQLYQWLVAPIEPDLQERQIGNLVFLPNAGLRSLPFAALHNGQEFLVQRYSLGLMPSLSLTDTRYVDIRDSQMLALGISESTEGQVPLPSVPVEISTLALDLWRGRIILNDTATLDNLRELRSQQPFGIIHMATHADFNGGAISNSYIQLWNDKLRMNQVPQMGWNDPPVEMLVLSACRTALGNEEAELGFAGLAVQAGVKSAVASLWYVSDVGTAALMTEFYYSLERSPIKAEALRQAQIAMLSGQVYLEDGIIRGLDSIGELPLPEDSLKISDRVLSHPYYWAAFTLIGNPW